MTEELLEKEYYINLRNELKEDIGELKQIVTRIEINGEYRGKVMDSLCAEFKEFKESEKAILLEQQRMHGIQKTCSKKLDFHEKVGFFMAGGLVSVGLLLLKIVIGGG